MSRERDDAMWRQIENALTPSADELRWADAEIELAQEPVAKAPLAVPAQPLADADDAASLRAAPRRTARQLAAAAALLLATTSVAWVGGKIVWPRKAPLIWSTTTTEADDLARSPDAEHGEWTRALGYFSGRHTSCVGALEALTADDTSAGDARVHDSARAALRRYVTGAPPAASSWRSSVDDAVRTAIDGDADTARRCEAIRYLEHFLRHAEATIESASADTSRRAAIRDAYLQGLEQKRSRLRRAADTGA